MSKVNWQNYACNGFYDELIAAPGRPRAEAKMLCEYLAQLESNCSSARPPPNSPSW
jgi:hypothetical protein